MFDYGSNKNKKTAESCSSFVKDYEKAELKMTHRPFPSVVDCVCWGNRGSIWGGGDLLHIQ